MKNKLKRIFSFFTVICLLLSVAPFAVNAAETVTVGEECTLSRNTPKNFTVNIREDGTYKLEIYALKSRRSTNLQVQIGTLYNQTIELNVGANVSTYGVTEITGLEFESSIYSVTLTAPTNVAFEKLVFTKTGGGTYTPTPEPDPVPTLPVLAAENTFSDGDIVSDDGSVSVSFGSDSEENAYKLSLEAGDTEGVTFDVYVNDELVKEDADTASLGEYVFPIGDNTLKITPSEDLSVSQIKLTKFDPTEVPIVTAGLNGVEPLSMVLDEGYHTESGQFPAKPASSPTYVELTNADWVKYKVVAPEEGTYLATLIYGTGSTAGEWVYLDNETNSKTIHAIIPGTGKITTVKEQNKIDYNAGAGYVDFKVTLSEGENILKFQIGNANRKLGLYSMKFELLTDRIETYLASLGGVPLLGTNKITPSADTMKVYFTKTVSDPDIASKFTLSDSEGNEIPLDITYEENVVEIDLLGSLQPEKTYNLTVSGVKSEKATMLEGRTYTFRTTQAKDDATSTLEIEEAKMVNESVFVKGTLFGSHGKPISGRKLKLYFVKGMERELLEELETGLEGKFELTASISAGDYDAGKFAVQIEPQYDIAATESENVYYVDAITEQTIKEAFAEADTTDKVKQVFKDYKQYMGFNAEGDATIVGANLFSHFISYNLTDMNTFYSDYNKFYVYEGLITATTLTAVENFLYNEADCKKIAVDYNKVSLIVNKKDDLLSAVLDINESDCDTFLEKLNEEIEKHLLLESEKRNTNVALSEVSVTTGQGFTLYANTALKQDSLKKAEMTFEFSSISAVDNTVEVASDYESDLSYTISSNKVKISADYTELMDINELFNAEFVASTVGSYTVNYSGKLYFDFEGYEVKTDIMSGSFTLSVNTVSSNPPKDTTILGGTGGGPSTKLPPKEEEDKKEETDTDVETTPETNTNVSTNGAVFNDIGNYLWAEESIIDLVNRGVISKAEDKKFRPGDSITREEFVKMIVCLLELKSTSTSAMFSDVPASHWAHPYISVAVENGLISGMSSTTFGTGTNITREQMAVIASRILEKFGYEFDTSVIENFADQTEISAYASDAVLKMKQSGIINGVGDDKFAPKANATRAAAAKIISGLAEVVGL